MLKTSLFIVCCATAVIASLARREVAQVHRRAIYSSVAVNEQENHEPMTAAEFGQFLTTLKGQLTSWKEEIEAIPFDSLDLEESEERGLLDSWRSECLKDIASAQEDIDKIRSEHSLAFGIWLLSDLYETRQDVDTLIDSLTNLFSARNNAVRSQGRALAKQNRGLTKQLNASIRTVRSYLFQQIAQKRL
jgi:hypothetical protein